MTVSRAPGVSVKTAAGGVTESVMNGTDAFAGMKSTAHAAAVKRNNNIFFIIKFRKPFTWGLSLLYMLFPAQSIIMILTIP